MGLFDLLEEWPVVRCARGQLSHGHYEKQKCEGGRDHFLVLCLKVIIGHNLSLIFRFKVIAFATFNYSVKH